MHTINWHNTYHSLPPVFYSHVIPTPVINPYLISFNHDVSYLLDISNSTEYFKTMTSMLCGNELIPNSKPIAMVYSGHQFGDYNPDLGDGRAVLLGQIKNKRNELWDMHLKGCGPTPYSRGFDGRSVLRSTIREYIASEAMHHLGIPTTRALCIIGTKTPVERTKIENGALLIRVAQSHVRFGSFEHFHYRKEYDHVRTLADYVVSLHFSVSEHDKYREFFRDVVHKTATLIAKWMAVGFVHGVMNTDNMSIIGLTLDYGPFGFMDRYDPNWAPNRTDKEGRYAFRKQPQVGLWNLKRLAIALSSLSNMNDVEHVLSEYDQVYNDQYMEIMCRKLGLITKLKEDPVIVQNLLDIMAMNKGMDYTNTFRTLCDIITSNDPTQLISQLVHGNDPYVLKLFNEWLTKYKNRISLDVSLFDQNERQKLCTRMKLVNPKYIPRTYCCKH
jgi:uncharacterized protein YdiU (UPF0061 family)